MHVRSQGIAETACSFGHLWARDAKLRVREPPGGRIISARQNRDCELHGDVVVHNEHKWSEIEGWKQETGGRVKKPN